MVERDTATGAKAITASTSPTDDAAADVATDKATEDEVVEGC